MVTVINELEYKLDKAQRIDKFLTSLYPDKSRSFFQKLILNGKILLNGKKVKKNYKLKFGDRISILTLEDKIEEKTFNVLYEDDYLAVIDKPAGIAVTSQNENKITPNTILGLILQKYPTLKEYKWDKRPSIVHRLDKYTSGVLLIAKNPQLQIELMKQFKNRQVKKIYYGIVHGKFDIKEGSIKCPIGRDIKKPFRFSVSPTGKIAITHFQVKKQIKNYALLKIVPITGRTHQIRVQLASISHPVVGDRTYSRYSPEIVERQLLHAYSISFFHPIFKKFLTIKAPLPKIFKEFIKSIE